jgi:hypothetical protein
VGPVTADKRGRIQFGDYSEHLESISDSQQELKNLAREVETLHRDFADATGVISALTTIEDYLGRLVTEYENVRRDFGDVPKPIPLEKLEKVSGFTAARTAEPEQFEKGGFSDVKKAFASIQELMRKDLAQ